MNKHSVFAGIACFLALLAALVVASIAPADVPCAESPEGTSRCKQFVADPVVVGTPNVVINVPATPTGTPVAAGDALQVRGPDATPDLRISGDGAIRCAPYVRHIQLVAKVDGGAANQPTTVDFGTVGGLQFPTTGSKFSYAQFEVPDDWDGGTMYFEVDWFPDSGGMSGSDTVKWTIAYRAIAEGETITNGGAAGSSVTDDADYAQYTTKHARFTMAYNDANQPLTVQDHVYVQVTRDTSVANDFGGSVTAAGYEVIYTSIGMPTSN